MNSTDIIVMIEHIDMLITQAIPYGATYYALVRARGELREALQHLLDGN